MQRTTSYRAPMKHRTAGEAWVWAHYIPLTTHQPESGRLQATRATNLRVLLHDIMMGLVKSLSCLWIALSYGLPSMPLVVTKPRWRCMPAVLLIGDCAGARRQTCIVPSSNLSPLRLNTRPAQAGEGKDDCHTSGKPQRHR